METDPRLGFTLRIAARRAKADGLITEDQRQKVRQAVRKSPEVLAVVQEEVLEEAFCRGLVTSAGAVPREIDCEQLMEILIQLLPIIIALF